VLVSEAARLRKLASTGPKWGGNIVRTFGSVRARFKIGMMDLGYNIRRLVQLERMAVWRATGPRGLMQDFDGGFMAIYCK
jgi:hypothetical protein